MIKIEFPAERTDIALAIGQALVAVAQGTAIINSPAPSQVQKAMEQRSENLQLAAYSQSDGVKAEDISPDEFGAEASTLAAAAVADLQVGATTTTAQGPAADAPQDEKGVQKDPAMCADAAKPFYASGPRKGQWKKRGGASGPTEDEYDAWYAAELAKVALATPQQEEPAQEPEIDVGSVWGGQQASQANQQQAAADTGEVTFANAGAFFAKVAEMQTAGHVTQADVDAAYAATDLNAGKLFTAAPAEQSAMCAALYSVLSAKVQA